MKASESTYWKAARGCVAAVVCLAFVASPVVARELPPDPAPVARAYLEELQGSLDAIAKDLPRISAAAERVAEAVSGDSATGISVHGSEGLRNDLTNSPGAMLMDPRGEVVFYVLGVQRDRDVDAKTLLTAQLRDVAALKERGQLVIAIGSRKQLRVHRLLGEAERVAGVLIDNHAGARSGVLYGEDGRSLVPLNTTLNLSVAWLLQTEFFAACTRRGEVPVARRAFEIDTRRDRYFRYEGQRFHHDCWLDPIPEGELGKKYLKELRLALRDVGTASWDAVINTADRASFAIQQDGKVYLLEVNPRASRTSPFVSKATGRPLAKIAARCMAGQTLKAQGIVREIVPAYYSVKESVFPFGKFPGVDALLGPEMRSTGEVMGVGSHFGEAFNKAQAGVGMIVPSEGTAFLSVRDQDKKRAIELARVLAARGFRIVATRGTADSIVAAGIDCQTVNKVKEGRPHCVDMIKNGEIQFITNTTEGKQSIEESRSIRAAAIQHKICYFTTMAGSLAAAIAMEHLDKQQVNRLQDLHAQLG